MTDSYQKRESKNEYARQYRLKNKKIIAEKHKDYLHSKDGLIIEMYRTQRCSSKRRNHPIQDYTLKEFKSWIFSQSNFDEIYINWSISGFDKMFKPSCDRIDDYKPYTLNNIKLTTWENNKKRGHEDRRNGINNKLSKSVLQLTREGIVVSEYPSSRFASRETGINQAQISRCCMNKNKTAGGFVWCFN